MRRTEYVISCAYIIVAVAAGWVLRVSRVRPSLDPDTPNPPYLITPLRIDLWVGGGVLIGPTRGENSLLLEISTPLFDKPKIDPPSLRRFPNMLRVVRVISRGATAGKGSRGSPPPSGQEPTFLRYARGGESALPIPHMKKTANLR